MSDHIILYISHGEGMDMKLPNKDPDEQLAKSFADKMKKKMTEGSKIIVMK